MSENKYDIHTTNNLGTVSYKTKDGHIHNAKISTNGQAIITLNDSKLGTCEFTNTFQWIEALDNCISLSTCSSEIYKHIDTSSIQNIDQNISYNPDFMCDTIYDDITDNNITDNNITDNNITDNNITDNGAIYDDMSDNNITDNCNCIKNEEQPSVKVTLPRLTLFDDSKPKYSDKHREFSKSYEFAEEDNFRQSYGEYKTPIIHFNYESNMYKIDRDPDNGDFDD